MSWPITGGKEIHRTIWRLEFIVQYGYSISAKGPVSENRGVLRNVYMYYTTVTTLLTMLLLGMIVVLAAAAAAAAVVVCSVAFWLT